MRALVLLALVAASPAPEIVSALPNPVAAGDAGERVVLQFPEETNLSEWSLADDDTRVSLPDRTVSGTVAVVDGGVPPPNATVVHADLSLSNAGEQIELRRANRTVDALSYEDAPEGELLDDEGWTPRGATDFAPARVENASVRAVVLPDAPVPIDAVRAADRRVYLGGYTLTSERVAAELERAAERGVDVRVLVEGGPAGGAPRPEARLLDRLAAAGIDVAVVDGPRARYRFHHAKYLVADGRAVVTTENWERGGTGGRGNRGWAVTVDSRRFADRLAALFRADAGWRDGVDWREYRPNASFFEESTGGDAYPNRFPPLSARADVTLLAAPDNAERRVVDLIGEAEKSVWIEQPSVDPDHPFVRAAVDAARRGVRVRVLLGRAWYDREENRALVDDLNALAAREGLPLRAKLVERRSRFERLHAKGLVVDDTALVGSINWNAVSTRENREVAALVESDRVADRYRRAMLADWRGGAWRIPVGVGVVALCATLAVAVLVRRVSFEGRRPGGSRRSRPPPSSR